MTTTELSSKTCTPCRGGIAPMAPDEARRYAEQTPGWALDDKTSLIERRFEFRDFAGALAFVNKVGALAEEEGHHPDIRFGWGYCSIVLYTHKIHGLHENDFIMAAKINELAEG
jgi:4a-hydroxytetrahydrobiopterin dehydratase